MLLDELLFALPVGLTWQISTHSAEHGVLAAGTTLAAVPVILLSLRMRRESVEAITAGAAKE